MCVCVCVCVCGAVYASVMMSLWCALNSLPIQSKSYTIRRAREERVIFDVSGKYLQWNPRDRRNTVFPQVKCPYLLTGGDKFTLTVAHAWEVRSVIFQAAPSNESRDKQKR